MKKLWHVIQMLWYGKVGEAWWQETDELCGKKASILDRLEYLRDYL